MSWVHSERDNFRHHLFREYDVPAGEGFHWNCHKAGSSAWRIQLKKMAIFAETKTLYVRLGHMINVWSLTIPGPSSRCVNLNGITKNINVWILHVRCSCARQGRQQVK